MLSGVGLIVIIVVLPSLKLDIVGTMCLPPIDNDPDTYFLEMKEITKILNLKEMSMGMSEDYLSLIHI